MAKSNSKVEEMSAAELRKKADEFMKKAEERVQTEIAELIDELKETAKKVKAKIQEEWDDASDDLKKKISEHVGRLPDLTSFEIADTTSTKRKKTSKRSWSKETKIAHVKKYDEAKKKRQGAKYLKGNDLNSNNIVEWRKAFLSALEASESVSDKP